MRACVQISRHLLSWLEESYVQICHNKRLHSLEHVSSEDIQLSTEKYVVM